MSVDEFGQVDLTVIIVSYNTVELTRNCLLSVKKGQGDIRLQIVVVDNNSSDGSQLAIKSEFPSVQLIENSDNTGFAVANNQALRIAKGEFVLLLNSDTLILDQVLQHSIDYLRAHPKVGAMGCRVLNSDRTMQPTCSGYPTLGRLALMTLGVDRVLSRWEAFDAYRLRRWKRADEREVDVISGCYLMLRADVLRQVGGLDEDFFFFGEETDWCFEIRKQGWQLRFAPVGEIVHYGGGSVKKLNFRREIMLTEGLVRFNRKRYGLLMGISVFGLLLFFNVSRMLLWAGLGLFNADNRKKAEYFGQIVANYNTSWPRNKSH